MIYQATFQVLCASIIRWSVECAWPSLCQVPSPPACRLSQNPHVVQQSWHCMSVLNGESLENRGDEGSLVKIYAVNVGVDLDANEFQCWMHIRNHQILWELHLDLDSFFDRWLCRCINQEDVINIQKIGNAITADIEVRISLSLCEYTEKEEDVHIIEPEAKFLFETIPGVSESHHDRWCVPACVFVALSHGFGEHYRYIIIIVITVEKSGDYVQVNDISATSPDQRDKISKGS